jgi:hypothetical protein
MLFSKFTVLRLLVFVNIILITVFTNQIYAQIKPSTESERVNGLQKRKLPEDSSLLKDIKFGNIGPG